MSEKVVAHQHLGEKATDALQLSDAERIRTLVRPHWLGYSRALAILQAIDELSTFSDPRRPDNLLLVGDPANGKSTILERYLQKNPCYQDDNGNPVRPVILARAVSGDEKSLFIAILEQFPVPYRASDSLTRLRYQTLHLMRACQVRVLIIDEFHSILSGTFAKRREVMNALKFLCNELKIPIVIAGTQDTGSVFTTDPQHRSRFKVLRLGLWAVDKSLLSLLDGFERVLPLRKPSNLPRMAHRLNQISEGNLGNLSMLLRHSARTAIESGSEQITPEIVEKHAWVRYSVEHGTRDLPL